MINANRTKKIETRICKITDVVSLLCFPYPSIVLHSIYAHVADNIVLLLKNMKVFGYI